MTDDWAVNATQWDEQACKDFAAGVGKSAVYMCDNADIFVNSNLAGGGSRSICAHSLQS